LYTKEYWYSKYFKVDKISDEFKEKLHNIMPEPNVNLGNAPVNEFMP
jgi:hypothetical protein